MFGFVRQSKYNKMANERDVATKYWEVCINEKVELERTIREMAYDIRSMDQLIYQMSQCTSWDQMRPYFNVLQVSQEGRQRNESNRIGGIMRRELLGVYTKESK